MAKSRSALTKKPKTKKFIAQATEAAVNEKYFGKTPPDPKKDRAEFLTWCNYCVDLKKARAWLEEYIAPRTARRVPDKWINTSACYRARMKTLGVEFNPLQGASLEESIRQMLAHVDESPETDAEPAPSIRDRIRERFSDVMGELEGMLDDGLPKGFSIEKWARDNAVSPTVMRLVVNKLGPRVTELMELGDGTCDQLNEAYRFMTPEIYEKMLTDLTAVVDAFTKMLDNEKRAKAPRKPKTVSMEKKLKHLVAAYQKFSKEFNINSIDPSKIVGAKELWTLNTKYKLLTVYRCDQMGGVLDVERCKVTGFNRNDSFTYRLGRGSKQASLIEAIIKSTKPNLKKVILGLKAAPFQERINENTILLRI